MSFLSYIWNVKFFIGMCPCWLMAFRTEVDWPCSIEIFAIHHSDVIMTTMASQLTSITGLGEGNSPVTVEFPAQRASNAENVSIWWRHHVYIRGLTHLDRTVLYTWRLQNWPKSYTDNAGHRVANIVLQKITLPHFILFKICTQLIHAT